jgi:hypothetical protein
MRRIRGVLVCYVLSEELLAAAYEARPTLFYDAARDGMLIAGPATLMSILWGIAHGLQHDARTRQRTRDRRVGCRTAPPLSMTASICVKRGPPC